MIEKKIGSVKVIECRGSHARIGETIGEALREELQQLIARQAGWAADDQVRRRIKEYLASAETFMPGVLEEIKGIERGANLPEHFLLSEWAETPTRSNFPEACSNIVFRDGPDGPLWGKANDGVTVGDPTNPSYCLLKIYPDDGLPLISCNYVGWIASGGMMNAEGVASGFSSGGSIFSQSPYHVPDLLWIYAGMQKARTAEEFARHLTSLPLRGKGLAGVTVDREGKMFSTEGFPPLVQIRRPSSWMRGMNCTNWYQLPMLTNLSPRTDLENSRGRSAYLETALKEGDLSVEYLKSVLRHHGECDICRHGAERHDTLITDWSMIGIPRQEKVLFASGNPCQGEYQEIGF